MKFDFNEERNFPLKRFETMLKTNEILFFDAEEFELITSHYLGIGKMALAQKAVQLGLEQHPHASVLDLLQVEILLFDNKLEEADAILNTLYDLEPSNPDIYIQKADVLSKRNQHHEAIDLLKTAEAILGEDEEVYALVAMEYMFLENYEAAKRNFLKCLIADETDSAALYNTIYCYEFLGQTEEAIVFLNSYLDRHPYSEIAWHQLGLQYITAARLDKALDCFEFAIISDDTFVGAYMERGKVLERLKRYTEAIRAFKITLTLEDPTAFAYLHLGQCYEKLGQNRKTLEFYNKALQEDPLLDKTWTAITEFYMHHHQYRQALHYIKKALALDEENIAHWQRYTEINKHLKQLKNVDKGLQKSLELDSHNFEAWINRGNVLIEMHHFKKARRVMEKADQLYPHTAEIEFRLAGLCFATGDENLGLTHLKHGLTNDPEYITVIQTLFPKLLQYDTVKKLVKKYES